MELRNKGTAQNVTNKCVIFLQVHHKYLYSTALVSKIEWKLKASQCSVFIFEIAMQWLPVRIIASQRHERGYISHNHLSETG